MNNSDKSVRHLRNAKNIPGPVERLAPLLRGVPGEEKEAAASNVIDYLKIVIQIVDREEKDDPGSVERMLAEQRKQTAAAKHHCPSCAGKERKLERVLK